MHIYEYLLTAVMIMAILLSSVSMVEMISEPARNVSEKEELKVAVQKLMTQILLNPGNPPDWGSNFTADSLKTFGLAKYSETTRDVYVLDPDKVLRLNDALLQLEVTSQLYIPPSRMRDLLNLGMEYGLALQLSPALTVTINKISDLDKYEVDIASDFGVLPIFGANVTARMFYYDASTSLVSSTGMTVNKTTYNGKCIVDFGNLNSVAKILVLVAEYYGEYVVKVMPIGLGLCQAYLLGDRLFMNETCSVPSNEVYEVIVTKKAGRYIIESVKSSISKVEDGVFQLDYVEPTVVAVLTALGGPIHLTFASLEANVTYNLSSGQWSFPYAYSVERTVTIGGSFYVMTLYVWRTSW
jgi:hypothetical protein